MVPPPLFALNQNRSFLSNLDANKRQKARMMILSRPITKLSAYCIMATCFYLGPLTVVEARNPPNTIEHERRVSPSINERQAVRNSQYQVRQAERDYNRAQHEARKYRGLSPSVSSGPYSVERWRSEQELQRAQRNLKRQESDLYSAQRRFESQQRDLKIRSQQRQQSKPLFQRSYPTIEHERRR